MGCVEISLSRSGSFPLDCPVTINVGKRVKQYYGQFEMCRSVTVTREQDSVRIELVGGEYEFSATCTIAVKDELVFATKILTSDKCNLMVPSDQIVTLRLYRKFDDLYLTGDKACRT